MASVVTVTSPPTVDGNSVTEEEEEENKVYRTYKRRWWIMLVYFYCSAAQGSVWTTWGPINFASSIVYGWGDTFTALVPAMADIGFFIMFLPLMYLTQTKGFRVAMGACACLLMISSSLWLIGAQLSETWMIYIGGILIGMTNGLFMSAPSFLSITWFPVQERTTATAIASASGSIGGSIAFLTDLGNNPCDLFLREYDPLISGSEAVRGYQGLNTTSPTPALREHLRHGILDLMYYNAGLVFAGFLMVLLYFPAKPPRPPSHSAHIERLDFRNGLKSLITNKRYLLINFTYNVSNGVFNSWLPLLSVSFKFLGITQETGGWLGFLTLVIGSSLSVVISVFVDRFKHKFKPVLILMTCGQIAGFVVLVCIQESYITFQSHTEAIVVLYVASILVGIFVNGLVPLYYELACESAFPVQEGLTCSLMALGNCIFGVIFFLIYINPTAAQYTQWTTWMGLSVCTISLLLIFLIKEENTRLRIEQQGDVVN